MGKRTTAPTGQVPAERIARAIMLIRAQRVMLDRDLAALYGVETRVLNQAVRRNRARFPSDFMFALSREEIRDISQIVISSTIKHARNVPHFSLELGERTEFGDAAGQSDGASVGD